MRIRLSVSELAEGEVAEVLVINGGSESVAGELDALTQSIEVDVAAPQAVVIREKMQA